MASIHLNKHGIYAQQMHSWDENTVFHDGVIALQILLTPRPQAEDLNK